MDIDTSNIIHVETVDKRHVLLKSPNMEREAVDRGLAFLQEKNFVIEEIVTDASSSVRKLLGKKFIMPYT